MPRPTLAILLCLASCRGPGSTDDEVGSSSSESETGTTSTSGSETGTSETSEGEGSDSSEADDETTPTDVLSGLGCAVEIPTDSDARWQAFVDQREAWLGILAEPIVACVAMQDTNHPAFHGCIDWHSAVHGTYALLALHRLTGEVSYLDAANAVLEPDALAGELADIEGDDLPPIEFLYGRAWFLLLARERELASGQLDLRPHAEAIADQLYATLSGASDMQLQQWLVADDYFSASWALLNLWRWAVHVDDQARVDWVVERVTNVAMALDCPLSSEVGFEADFFPPCLQRANLVLSVLPQAQTSAWLDTQLAEAGAFALEPLCMPGSAHSAGLNFSRAFGLWALWAASGDTDLRDLYVEHVWRHVEQPAYWAQDYSMHSHWIAQFGVHAISLSY